MSTILEQIKAYKLEEIANRKAQRSLEDVEASARAASPTRGFYDALYKQASTAQYGLIAEIKKASPSKGLIRADFDPPVLAKAYEDGGATCLSILTDGPSFQGDDSYLVAAREAVGLPVIRKDFMYDPYQVVEARALGADCILIIMASVSDDQAVELENTAFEQGMDVLVEVHNLEEMERSHQLKSRLLGINNRDLNTFETSLTTTETLAREVPAEKLIVGESGLRTRSDLARLAQYGVRCFLIGESLMREENVEGATRALISSPWTPEAA